MLCWPENSVSGVRSPRYTRRHGLLPRRARRSRSSRVLSAQEICDALSEMEHRPWPEFGKHKKPITQNQLARLLDQFKIRPKKLYEGSSRENQNRPRGYFRSQFEKDWQRYLAPQGADNRYDRTTPTAAGTSGTFQPVRPNPSYQLPTGTTESVVPPENGTNPLENNPSTGRTTSNGGGGPPRDVCAQCGASDDGSLQPHGSVWLHPECVRFFSRH